MKIALQNGELGAAGGVGEYSGRLSDAFNKIRGVECVEFIEVPPKEFDVMLLQYEPAICPQSLIERYLKTYTQPIVITAHHSKGLDELYNVINGFVFHSKSQITTEPFNYTIIPHPSLVFENLNKKDVRRELGLPLDKKIVGTAGFVYGAGKNLPTSVKEILKRLNDDEFLYLTTSVWKGGDGGRISDIKTEVKRLGKEDQFRMDTDYVSPKDLNKRLQACDLLYSWSAPGPNQSGCQSGIAADMYGSRRKLIVQNTPRYDFIANQDKVEVGSKDAKGFAKDLVKVLREGNLKDVQDPEWLSWDNQAKRYHEYIKSIKEMFE